jgi:hypothetical protein
MSIALRGDRPRDPRRRRLRPRGLVQRPPAAQPQGRMTEAKPHALRPCLERGIRNKAGRAGLGRARRLLDLDEAMRAAGVVTSSASPISARRARCGCGCVASARRVPAPTLPQGGPLGRTLLPPAPLDAATRSMRAPTLRHDAPRALRRRASGQRQWRALALWSLQNQRCSRLESRRVWRPGAASPRAAWANGWLQAPSPEANPLRTESHASRRLPSSASNRVLGDR